MQLMTALHFSIRHASSGKEAKDKSTDFWEFS
jgi:hypothetical protein